MQLISFLKKKQKTIKIGSIWQAPNKIWTNGFAKNKAGGKLHPAIIERINSDGITYYLTPGTTRDYNIGTCVFKTRLSMNLKKSYFLLKLTMPYIKEDLDKLKQGWSNVYELSHEQKNDLFWQIKMCKGIEVKEPKQRKRKWWKIK